MDKQKMKITISLEKVVNEPLKNEYIIINLLPNFVLLFLIVSICEVTRTQIVLF